MKHFQLLLLLTISQISILGQVVDNNIVGLPSTVFDHLVWSDEFNIDGALDSNKWYHQTKLPAGGNWYNGEVQHYTDRTDNSIVVNGILNIIAKKEFYTAQGVTKDYTSARLNSKFAFKYGKIVVRAKLPYGVGTWPAIWTLGKNIIEDGAYFDNQGYGTTSWPACGEIDIMEHWGSNQNYVQSATHTPSSYGGTVNLGGRLISNASTSFHIYCLEWTSEKLVFSVDSIVHYTYNPPIKDASTWPFDSEQYLLLNVAILPNISASFTNSNMEIDYVRIYQESGMNNSKFEIGQDFAVYPNPFNESITISGGSNSAEDVKTELYNISGQLINVYNIESYTGNYKIDNLKHLPKGIYLLKFNINGLEYTRKLIKN